MGRITIYLTGKGGEEQTADYKVEYSDSEHNNIFKIETITIKYFKSNEKYTLRFRKNFYNDEGHPTIVFYTYYSTNYNQVIEKIQVYTSKFHKDNPLVVAFQIKGNSSFKYFTYSELKKHTSSYGVLPAGDFGKNQLDVKLKDENEHRNKIFFNNTPKQHQNYSDKTDSKSFGDYTRYKLYPKDDDNYQERKMSKDKLLEKEKLEDSSVVDKLLEPLVGKPFDSISIYYIKNSTTILLIEFINESTKTHFVRKDETGVYWTKENLIYSDSEQLKNHLDTIKSGLANFAFMLDKNQIDKFKNKITVSIDSQKSYEFTKYIHTPVKTGNAIVLYNYTLLNFIQNEEISENKLESVKDKQYGSIETYSLIKELNFHLMAKFTVTHGSEEYYFQRYNKQGTQWKQIKNRAFLSTNQNIKYKLLEIDYLLKKSLILIINEKIRYNSGTISNSSVLPNTSTGFVIVPKYYSPCGTYSCYNHSLSTYTSHHKNDVIGIRLKYEDNEIKLYDGDVKEENRQYIYYNSAKKDFYVYFYSQDNRPLMLCYNNKVYTPSSKENFSKNIFSLVNGINCPCQKNDKTFTDKLNDIYDQFNEVDISQVREYIVHTYNKHNIKINVKSSQVGCYIRYTHTPSSHNGLGTIKYKSNYIKDSNRSSYIKASGKKEVVVYYNLKDISLNIPLLIALCTNNNCKETNLYYELQKNDSSQEKIYKKGSQSIIIDTSSQGSLVTKLDEIFHSFTNSLIIVLDKRPNNYKSKLTSNNKTGQQRNTQITVEQANYPQLDNSGYECYLHKITSITEIGEVGGLKFHLYDSKELNLYNDSVGNSQMTNIKYTTCKGNVLVIFYGSDPRPLLMCFDSKWYRPKDITNYENKWVLAESIKNCDCSSRDFDAEKILDTLYGISMELNPVNLGVTEKAYKGQGQNDGHSYTIHDYTPQPINVKIVSKNFNCYKQYSHQPENGSNRGYRLGNINYNSNSNCGILYSKEKPLQKVLLYYSVYDTGHKYPLLIKLDFKGGSSESEYYRLDDKVDLKWEKLLINRYKGLIEKLSNDDNLENGLYDIRTKIDIKYNDDEKKNYFFNPEKCTEDKISIAAVAGGTAGAAAVVGTGITIGIVVAKKLAIATVTSVVAAAVA